MGGREGPGPLLRFPHPVRWRQEHRLRPDLRQQRGHEEVRAPLQARPLRPGRQEEEIDDSISSRYFWVMRLCAAFHYGFDTCMTGCKSKARTAFSHVVGVAT